ncbi:MAG: transposase [Lentisphaeria bacterium]|nr:transposase [Candidatus Neomarinimicrobiota bacterium]MCF7841317.1 transposase [Lentisphaeria bacterium]
MHSERQRRQYPAEFKRESVELLLRSRKPAKEIADDLGITANMLHRWKREYLADQSTAFPGTGHLQTPEEEQIRALERELRSVKEERDILKKVVSIFSKDPK